MTAAVEAVPLPGVLLPQGLDLGAGAGRRQVADGDLVAFPDRTNSYQVLSA